MASDNTKALILAAGVRCARKGLHLVTARRVAAEAGLHHSNVAYHYKTGAALLDAVACQAVADADSCVIARLILDNHEAVAELPGVERDGHMLRVSAANRYT